ncbi:MAG: hypothetical protein ACOYJK_09270 [Prevotella sp.]|jgi:hypothetical protein
MVKKTYQQPFAEVLVINADGLLKTISARDEDEDAGSKRTEFEPIDDNDAWDNVPLWD